MKGAYFFTNKKMKKQFIIDEKGNRSKVVLPINEYNRLVEEIEDLQDALDAAGAREEVGEAISWEDFKKKFKFGIPGA